MTRDPRTWQSVLRQPKVESPREDWSEADTLAALDREARAIGGPARHTDETLHDYAVRLAAFRLKARRK